jgi:DNA-binding NtrC family response regulator
VRELEATIHRAIVMSTSDDLSERDFQGLLADSREDTPPPPLLDPNDLPREVLLPMFRRIDVDETVYSEVISSADRQLIEQALASSGGRIRETARRLGIARNTLKSKIDKYGVKSS